MGINGIDLENLELLALTVELKWSVFWFGFSPRAVWCMWLLYYSRRESQHFTVVLSLGLVKHAVFSQFLSYRFSVMPSLWIVLLMFFFFSVSKIKALNELRSGGILQIIIIQQNTKYQTRKTYTSYTSIDTVKSK